MRRKIALVAVISLVLLAGCSGLTTYDAPPAETDSDLAEEYNYNMTSQEELKFEDNVTIAGYTQDIRMSSWITLYEKDISDELRLENDTQSPIVYATVNTPSINVSGQEFNPLSQQPTDEVVTFLSNETDENVEIHDKVDEFNTTHTYTEKNMTVSKYEATFTVNEIGAEFRGYVLVSIVELDDSIVLMFGSYPEAYQEEDNITELMKHTQSVEENSEE